MRLKKLRLEKNYRQVDLANKLVCNQATYSRYESGRRNIPNDVLIKLAELFETSVDYLIGRTDNCN